MLSVRYEEMADRLAREPGADRRVLRQFRRLQQEEERRTEIKTALAAEYERLVLAPSGALDGEQEQEAAKEAAKEESAPWAAGRRVSRVFMWLTVFGVLLNEVLWLTTPMEEVWALVGADRTWAGFAHVTATAAGQVAAVVLMWLSQNL